MKVLIEGLGSIAQKHINALKNLLPNVEIYGLRSSIDSLDIEGVVNIYDYKELLRKPDFIIISNSTQFHRNSIRKALFLDVPLMIEKPVLHAITQEDITIIDELKDKNIKTYVACNSRFHPVLIFLNNYLKQNNKRINEVNVYCGSYFPNWRPNRNYKEIYSAKNEDGGGIHLELIHELDYTCWLFGMPNHVKRTLSSKSSIEIDAPDYAHYLLEYQDFFASITLNFYRKKNKRSIEILFDDDTWTVDIINSTITNDKNEIVFSNEFKIIDTYTLQMQHMIDIVTKNTNSINNYQDSLQILKICLTNG
jgi:predicted dehydrogenase